MQMLPIEVMMIRNYRDNYTKGLYLQWVQIKNYNYIAIIIITNPIHLIRFTQI